MNNGAFGEGFPYSNFHDLNMDWIISVIKDFLDNKSELMDGLEGKINKPTTNPNGNPDEILISLGNGETEWKPYDYITPDLEEYVYNWLAEHPEATTTVEDGSLTNSKFTDELKLETIKDYITPQMFGAVGDGETDDTQAIQDAINYSHENGLPPICLISDYHVTATLQVPDRISFFALTSTEGRHKILVDDNINPVFNCTVRDTFKYICIDGYNGEYKNNTTAFKINGVANNADCVISNCHIFRVGTGIEILARNVDMIDNLIVHCRYGIFVNLNPNMIECRGINIQGCRFHGIGEEYALNNGVLEEILISGQCAGILLHAENQLNRDQESDIIIQNCICDQGGTFIEGRAQNCLVSNCFIACFAHPAFKIAGASASVTGPLGGGAWLISGCLLQGIAGMDGQGVTHDRTDNLIEIENYGNITISDCLFGKLNKNPIKATSATNVSVIGCTMIYTRNGSALIEEYTNSKIIAMNNTNIRGSKLFIAIGDNTSYCYYKNNMRFYVQDTGNLNYQNYYETINIANGNSGGNFPLIAKYDTFYVRRTEGETCFRVEHLLDGYYTSSCHITSDGAIETIKIDRTTYKVSLIRTDGTTISELSVPIYIMAEI